MPSDDARAATATDIPLPELPAALVVASEAQLKAAFDPLRSRVLQLLRERTATAKQLATWTAIAPSLMNYHLRILTDAGLVQVIARRPIHGIPARYYTRTARVFIFRPPPDAPDAPPIPLRMLDQACDELAETLLGATSDAVLGVAFPHARLSGAQAQRFQARLGALIQEFLHEPADADGDMYAWFTLLARSPRSLQRDEKA